MLESDEAIERNGLTLHLRFYLWNRDIKSRDSSYSFYVLHAAPDVFLLSLSAGLHTLYDKRDVNVDQNPRIRWKSREANNRNDSLKFYKTTNCIRV